MGQELASAATLFFDDFNIPASDVNRNVWTTPGGDAGFFGRTAIRNPDIPDWMTAGLPKTVQVGPSRVEAGTSVAQLQLSTYNPTDQGNHETLWGSEIDSLQTFQPSNSEGIVFEARVRAPEDVPKGAITSFFGFGLTGDGLNKDEVDVEFLSNLYKDATTQQILLNHFLNKPPNAQGDPAQVPASIQVTQFNVYKVEWFDHQLQWYINDQLVHSAADDSPQNPLSVRFNFWAPSREWPLAYSSDLVAAETPADNKDYVYEVDWVRVSTISWPNPIPEPTTFLLLGTGLAALSFRGKKRQKVI